VNPWGSGGGCAVVKETHAGCFDADGLLASFEFLDVLI